MIADKKSSAFSFDDLVEFYKIVNEDEDFNYYNEDHSEDSSQEEIEMAHIVFGMMKKTFRDKVTFIEFKNFITRIDDHVKLFDFLKGDAESSRKDIRVKRSFILLLKLVESLLRDIDYLNSIIFPDNTKAES